MVFLMSMTADSARSATIQVPGGGYPTIQSGIDAANNGDTVLVANGTHTGSGNVNLDFKGKAITVRSANGVASCIIDCGSANDTRGFLFYSGEGSTSVVEGFTIQNGRSIVGGGIYCWTSGPTIKNNVITGNWAEYGGGIYFEENSSPVIENNVITGNSAFYAAGIGFRDSLAEITGNIITENTAVSAGGGMGYSSSIVTMTNNVIARNSAEAGGGIGSYSSTTVIVNNTFTGNLAEYGDGMGCYSSNATIVNTIVWEDDLEGIYLGPSNTVSISYSDIKGGQAGINSDVSSTIQWLSGNINADPLFVNASVGNYHLPNASPCIGGGTSSGAPSTDIENNPRPNPSGSNPDIGAYENPLGTASLFNNIPVAYDQSVATDDNTPVNITLTGSDLDSDPLTYIVVDAPSNGLLTGIPPNVTYTPDPGFSDIDSFTFKVNDGEADSNVATVSIIVGGSLFIKGLSPVDLEVTDPEGRIINKSISTIPSASYTEEDLDGDGDLDDKVLIPDPITGVYSIEIIPEPGSASTDTYTLDISYGSYTARLAENVMIQDIPGLYGLLFSELAQGWDLMSIPLQPPDTAPGAVLASVDGEFNSVWAFDPDTYWSVYAPGVPSDLGTVEPGRGYWIKMDQPGVLIVHGIDPDQTDVFLKGGEWNLVGYNSRETKRAEDCMSSVENFINSVWEYNPGIGWLIYAPGQASDLEFMRPGRGYWIKAYVNCVWDVNF